MNATLRINKFIIDISMTSKVMEGHNKAPLVKHYLVHLFFKPILNYLFVEY